MKSINRADLYVLLALSDQPRHGYGIMQHVSAETQGSVKLRPGTLYTAIKRLTDQGLIAEVKSSSSQDPRRRYYAIKTQGLKQLNGELDRLTSIVSIASTKGLVNSSSCEP